jgi:hypothetical protein
MPELGAEIGEISHPALMSEAAGLSDCAGCDTRLRRRRAVNSLARCGRALEFDQARTATSQPRQERKLCTSYVLLAISEVAHDYGKLQFIKDVSNELLLPNLPFPQLSTESPLPAAL